MQRMIFLMMACVSGLNCSAQLQVFESGSWAGIRLAAQDSAGRIYGAGGTPGSTATWIWDENWRPNENGSPWMNWGSGLFPGAKPVFLEPDGNGDVVWLWERSTNASVVAVHQRGSEAYAVGGAAQGPARLVRVLGDSQTNWWVTSAGWTISRTPEWRPDSTRKYSKPQLIHTISSDELWPGGSSTNRLPVSMAEDGHGRIWFWSSYLMGSDDRGAIRGTLMFDHGLITNLATLAGVRNDRISIIAPLSKSNLWLAIRNAGLFTLDLDTLQGTLIQEPEPRAFDEVQKIFSVGDDRYVIVGVANRFNKDGLLNSLWRLHSGQWQKIVDGLDSEGTPELFADRHWLATADGLWLTGFGTGGWFVSSEDFQARQISWEVSSPFDTIDRWFQLKNGQMLALQFGRGGFVGDAPLLAVKPAVAPTSRIIRTASPLIQTQKGKIFGVLRGNELALSEWDGEGWHRHPFPTNQPLSQASNPASDCHTTSDSQGRIWFIDPRAAYQYDPSQATRGLCLIFDPATGRFQAFSNYRSALQAQLSNPQGFRLGGGEALGAEFSGDGRICYHDEHFHLCYYDGQQWRQWYKGAIAPVRSWKTRPGESFFSHDGKLSTVIDEAVWQFDESDRWTLNASEKAPDDNAPTDNSEALARNLPENPPLMEADSVVSDARGIFWITAHRQLARAGYGLRLPCFPPNEPQPFADGRKLLKVLVDNQGNGFLLTTLHAHQEYVLVPARRQPPKTDLKVIDQPEDRVALELSAPGTARPRFGWRVDDGPWNSAATNTIVLSDDLPNGKHRVQVMTIDEQLQTGLTEAEVTIALHSSPAQRIQKLITQLGDADYSKREAAVKALARQPEGALLELRRALKGPLSPEQEWWLQAAIQACEDQNSH